LRPTLTLSLQLSVECAHISARQILHHHVHTPLILAKLMNMNNVAVVKPRHDPRLVNKAPHKVFLFCEVREGALEGYKTLKVRPFLSSEEDLSHPTHREASYEGIRPRRAHPLSLL
jgi:hypothetical protein